MARPRLAPGKGSSPRIYVPVTDSQRAAIADHVAQSGCSTAQLVRDALAEWLAAHPIEEVAKAS